MKKYFIFVLISQYFITPCVLGVVVGSIRFQAHPPRPRPRYDYSFESDEVEDHDKEFFGSDDDESMIDAENGEKVDVDNFGLTPKQQNRHNELWEIIRPRLRLVLNEYELMCLRKRKDFPRSQIESELENCFRPSIVSLIQFSESINSYTKLLTIMALTKFREGSIMLEQDELDAIKKTLIEPGCMFTLHLFKCFKPHNNYVIDKCSSGTEGLIWSYGEQLFVSVCKNNGSRVIDYFNYGGMDCAQSLANQTKSCFKKTNQGMFGKKSYSEPDTFSKSRVDTCTDIDKQRTCFSEVLQTCEKTKPVKALSPILLELEEWSKLKCSDKDPEPEFSMPLSSSQNLQSNFITICISVYLMLN